MLGLKRGTVFLADHDANWSDEAELTIKKLKNILGETAIRAEHVGSTSIPGIKAKPIIDIAVGVADFGAVLDKKEALRNQGFEHQPDNDKTWQVLFSCGDKEEDIVTHHIHVVKHNGSEWEGYTAFRDRLRRDIDTAKAYEALKVELMVRFERDRDRYTEAKAAFILGVLEESCAKGKL